MTIKIISTFDVSGNGHDTHNAAVFSVRDEFDELYGGGRQVLHRFLHEDQRVTTEPEVAIIAKLPGVVKVYVFGGSCSSPYDLSIKKASAYDWAELVPKIEQLLTERGERIERERLSGSDVEVPQ